MTVAGKCDVCRKRKVKCDEEKPRCGSCIKVNRDCRYTYGNFSHFVLDQTEAGHSSDRDRQLISQRRSATKNARTVVSLTLRSSRGTNSGNCLFQTFAAVHDKKKPLSKLEQSERNSCPPRLPAESEIAQSPKLDPTSPETRLVSRFATACGLNAQENPLTILGDCIGWVQYVVWHSEVGFAATQSLVDSLMLYNAPTDEHTIQCRKSTGLAICAVRSALPAKANDTPGVDLLLAIRLLFLVEIIQAPTKLNYIFHLVGLNSLLHHVCDGGNNMNEISRSVYYSSAHASVFHDILLERDTIYDNGKWLQCSPPKDLGPPDGTGTAWQVVMKIGIRFARLVRLVRHARHFPEDSGTMIEASSLATELYALNVDDWIEELQEKGILNVYPTSDTRLKSMVENSYHFPSTRLLSVLIQYWEFRTMVCGTLQTLLDVPGLYLPLVDRAEVQRNDVNAAESLIMCFEHMHKIAQKCPVVELRFVFPMEMAFGAWYRLEQRERLTARLTGDDEADMRASAARDMQIRCLENQNWWKQHWSPGERLNFRAMVWLTETVSGGDIRPNWQSEHRTAS